MTKVTSTHCQVLVIGGGPAGYTASIYAARAGLRPIQLLGPQPGGQLMITTDVENYPGFAEAVQGPWLMEQMYKQAEHVGVKLIYDTVVDVKLTHSPFECIAEEGVYNAQTIIIATGAQAKWLGIPSEEKFRGFGVSACATCDGFFFRNKKVVVVGGGNTAVEEALYLTQHAAQVIVVHRRNTLRAEDILQQRLLNHPKISVIWNHTVDEILGTSTPSSVTGIRLRSTDDPSVTQNVDCDGVFVAIGHTPMSSVFRNALECDNEGYIKTLPGTVQTSIPGVFAAGDVQDKIYRQAVTAAGQGCMAALDAQKFLSAHGV